MRRKLTLLLAPLLGAGLWAAAKSAAPDFAYPDKVAKNASAALERAIKADDGPAIVEASIQYSLSQTVVSTDNIPAVITRLDEVSQATADQSARSMIDIIKATIYTSAYNSSRWTYDSRQLPLSPLPDDYRQWSADQFAFVTDSLCNAALANSDALLATPVSAYASSVSLERGDIEYYPTLFDFVVTRSIDLLGSYDNSLQRILPVSALSTVPHTGQYRNLGLSSRRLISLYDRYAAAHPAGTPPRLAAETERLHYISSLVYNTDDDNMVREALNKAMLDLYDADSSHGWALYALTKTLRPDTPGRCLALYDKLGEAVNRHPDAPLTPNLREVMASMSNPSVSISCPATASPGRPLHVSANVDNAGSVRLHLYRITGKVAPGSRNVRSDVARKEITTVDLELGERPVIYADTVTATLTLPEYGLYALRTEVNGVIDDNRYLDLISCTDLALFTSGISDDTRAIVVNNGNGKPISGATVNILSGGYGKQTPFGSLTTGDDGSARITRPDYGNLYPSMGADRFAPLQYYYLGDREDNDTNYAASIYTDLPLYHPGDTMRGAVVAYSYDLKGHRPLADSQITVTLRDANYQEVGALHLTTDSFGRAEFDFALPTAGLTGTFSLTATMGSDRNVGYRQITVSDYKLPTFEVVIDSVRGNAAAGEVVTIAGRAMYYSGFPVSDADIAVTLRGERRMWWRTVTTPEFYTSQLRTDADGRFTLDIGSDILGMCPVTGANIRASFAVTASNGETCLAESCFATGKPYTLAAGIGASCDTARPVACNITATDAAGKEANVPVLITVKRDTDALRTIEAVTPVQSLDLHGIASGPVTIIVTAGEEAEAAETSTVLYTPGDTECPVASALWVPVQTYRTDIDMVDILYGTADADANILMSTTCAGKLGQMQWLTPGAGLHHLNIRLTDRSDNTIVTLTTVRDGKLYTEDITIRPTGLDASIRLEIESFRDKVTAGTPEQWTIRVTGTDGSPAEAALMMTMYNKALTTLASQPWNLGFREIIHNRLSVSMNSYSLYDAFSLPRPRFDITDIAAPQFNTYGRSFAGDRIYIRGSRRMMTAAAHTTNALMLEESVECEAVADCAAPMMQKAAATTEAGAGSEEVAVDNANDGSADYRPSEIASAFFAPMLTTGADGTLQYSFNVPDANTAWQLNAMAYTSGLLNTSDNRLMTSSKPVMVNINAPRFVRRGDTVCISVSVMNNTDADADITFNCEAGDDVSGSTLHIAAMGTATESIQIHADNDASALTVRVKASDGTFSDGEQILLPVLEATQPVIETYNSYIAPETTTAVIDLPAAHDDSQVSLQVCENIAWQVVTALPGLRTDDMQTANAAIARIFSAAVARGLMRDNPEIADAIHQWTAGDRSDSTLVSMLSRNADLKQMMLSATPWMQAAANDTGRMDRLALLFDNKLIDSTIATDIKLLSDLQTSSGGWRWMAGYDAPSQWTTTNVLTGIAELRRLGYMPDSGQLEKMTANALAYLDRETADEFSKYPKGDYSFYAWLRTSFDNVALPGANRRIVNTAVQRTISDWKDDDLTAKAIDAMLLERNGYHASALQVIESLRQYATTSVPKGMWWPRLQQGGYHNAVSATSLILNAFNEVTPSSPDLDRIRQWLIVNKTTQDWGTGVQTTQVIASLLGCGTRWTVPARGLQLSIDGNSIDVPATDSRTGYFVSDITPQVTAGGRQLSVEKLGQYPSFISVIDRYTGVMRQVEAKGCDELTIAKRHLVKQGTGWVESDTAHVGDIVKISLTLTVNQSMDYVAIVDNRAACMEPVEQLPTPIIAEGLYFYRENRDSATNLFINHLPAGVYILEYEMKVTNSGSFASGLSTAQSQYAPAMTAHSAGTVITIE